MYDGYAPVYDAIGQGRYSATMAARSLGWLAERGAVARRVLDLACGTGEAALVFAAAGCQVAGVDRSAQMLAIARGKARDAGYPIELVQGDIRELRSIDHRSPTTDHRRRSRPVSRRPSVVGRQSSFDLVTCFADSLNYLTEDGDLDRVFAGAAGALRPGGYLICDINAAAEYASWDERDVVTHDGGDILVYNRLSYDPAARLASGRIVWFAREIERWWRGEETHVERAWSDAEVSAALAGAGLRLDARLDVEGNAAAPDARRVVYVAWREQKQRI